VDIKTEFGRQNDILAALAKSQSEVGLRFSAAIAVGSVKEVYPEVECPLDDSARRIELQPFAEIVASQPDQGHAQTRLS